MSEAQNILKRSLVELRELRARLQEAERVHTEPIAIIGIGCRLPGGVHDPESYWRLLSGGVDGTREIPDDRWDVNAFYDPDPNAPGKMYVRRGGFLDEIANFDPEFFNIPPREAQSMDPQHRLVLEVAWEALENAGIAPDQLANTPTGVFIGITSYDYAQHILQTTDLSALDAYVSTGNPLNFSAGRISYLLGLQGPSIALDTACSSSLVSVHLACNSLRLGESQVALAGGVNLIMMPETMVTLAKAKMLAADGRCKTFDASADGYGRGEGCGMLVLKRLSNALADGDNIWAVIRGSAVNQDGPSSGLTVPNGQAQQQLIQTTLKNARIDANEVVYVEAHGTGTSLGDPIELRALNAVLGQERRADQPLIVGSVKTNIGHLEAAAGVAGLTKVALSLHHNQIPPHLNLKTPNPNVNWESLNLCIPSALESFPKYSEKRFAAISGFGVSGTNAHIILESGPEIISQPSAIERPAHILTISAPHAESLPELAQAYAKQIDSQPEALGNIAYTANTGRAQFAYRAAFVASSVSELSTQLSDFATSGTTGLTGEVRPGQRPKLAWMFTGQGAQVSGMAHQLYETQPIFRAALDTCAEILRPYLEHDLLDVLFNPALSAELDQTIYTQPALFAVEYALAQLWMSWGVQPAAVIGHSVGEYAAACIAGVFSLDDGLNLIATRGRLMQKLPLNGRMAAVFADAATVEKAIQPYAETVSIGAYNGPQMTVISGLDTDIQRLVDDFAVQGITARDLRISHAFHSPLMQPILNEFAAVVSKVQFHPPRIPVISNVTGTAVKEFNADYWVQHIRQPVRFQQGMQALYDAGNRVFLEIGPKPTLTGMGKRILTDVRWLASLDGGDDWETLLNSLGALYTLGVPINWKAFDEPYTRRRQRLPNTPYQRERYWIGEGNSNAPRRTVMQSKTGGHPLLGQPLNSPLIQYETTLSPQSTTLVDQHIIYGSRVLPGIVWIEMGMAAHGGMDSASTFSLEKFTLRQPIIFDGDARYTAQIVATADHVDIYSQHGDDWHLNASMELHVNPSLPAHTETYSAEAIQKRAAENYDAEYFYANVWHPDFHLGESFRCVEHIWRRDGEALARMHMPQNIEGTNVRPELLLLDACVQVIIAAMLPEIEKGDVYIGFGQEYTRIYRPFSQNEAVWCQAVLNAETLDSGTITGSLTIFDDAGVLIGELNNVAYRRVKREGLLQSARVTARRAIAPVNKISRAALTAMPSDKHPAALRTYLSELVGQVTGIGAAKIDPQRSLLDMVDSLMSVELKSHIERDLQVDVPLSEILGGQSIDDIVNTLLSQMNDSVPADEGGMSIAEMQALVVLPADIQPQPSDWASQPIGSVLLTGATGFVGAFLLAELLAQTSADIYCLVRAETEEIAHQRLRENLDFYRLWNESYQERIKPVPGDLAQPRLGLSEEIFESLAQKIDLIWHCGAAVKWTFPYAALAPANVQGTIEILRLATQGKTKPLHHVSTVGVFSSRAFDGQTITESTPLDSGGTLYTGYAQTKWVSEALVRAAAARGLPVNIYRINTAGDSRTGIYNPHDYLPLLLKGCIELGSAPDDLDLVIQGAPVDFAAAAMVYLSSQPRLINQTYHIVNPQGMTWREVTAVLRESGQLLHTTSYQEWQAQVQEYSQQDSQFALAGLSALFTEAFPDLTHLPLFDNRHVIEALKETHIICPPFDSALLQRYLKEMSLGVTR